MKQLGELALKIRKRNPPFLRRWLRLAKHAAAPGKTSPGLPPHLIAGCQICASRYDLVQRMPHGARVAEVGVEHGLFSQYILSATNPAELHLIDLDYGSLSQSLREDDRVRIHQGVSHEVLGTFPTDYFDWIYIDADHSYSGVRRDIQAASDKVRPGGFLVFNDFAHVDPYLGAYGVHRAVIEFAVERQWPLAWWAYDPNALYDVALQRPAT